IATFFCSLLAGGYLLYANYKALGMRNLAYYTLAASVVIFSLLLWVMSSWIDSAASDSSQLQQATITANLVAAVAQAIIAVVTTQFLQGPMFTTFNEMKGQYHSTWQAFFIGLCAAFVLSMLLAFLAGLFNVK
ncbi:MAG: hypothetical protein VYA12_10120, partial [Pseudomonadota bacterium]|nr:hypothetical protein [Pseudomonadota bacterium]